MLGASMPGCLLLRSGRHKHLANIENSIVVHVFNIVLRRTVMTYPVGEGQPTEGNL